MLREEISRELELEGWNKKGDSLIRKFNLETEDPKIASIVELTLVDGKIKLGVFHSKRSIDSKLSHKMITCELPFSRQEIKLISNYINLD